MVNLKQDILNNLGNQKYYIELELARQAQDPNMVYEGKVMSMSETLKEIAEIDLATQLVGKYFPEQQPQENAPQGQPPVDAPKGPADQPDQPQTNIHPGQSHGE